MKMPMKTPEDVVAFLNVSGLPSDQAECVLVCWLEANGYTEVSNHQKPVKGFVMYEFEFAN